MLNLLRKSAARRAFTQTLYDQLVARARAPVFFRDLGVPDSLDGRFDLVALHAWLVLERLSGASAQALTDMIFTGFDEALREQGTGDMGMGRKMKAMADAFFGRLVAYRDAQGLDALTAALAKNVWRGLGEDSNAIRLAAYVQSARLALATCDIESGVLDFGALP